MIEINHVSKEYNKKKVVDDVSIDIRKGQILGLLGTNGAGKTTLIKMIAGYHFPSSGNIKINNMDIKKDSFEVRKVLGYLPENAPLYQDLTVCDYLDFIFNIRLSKKYYDKIHLIDTVLEKCELKEVYYKKIEELSKGFKQRVCFAQSIMHDPDILILDEPTTGLDPNQIQSMRKVIKDFSKTKTVILSTHLMQEVNAICDSVVIINKGKVVISGKTEYIESTANKEDIFDVVFKVGDDFDIEIFNYRIANLIHFEVVSKDELILSVKIHLHKNREWENSEVIYDFALENGVKILSIKKQKLGLDEIFTSLTNEQN